MLILLGDYKGPLRKNFTKKKEKKFPGEINGCFGRSLKLFNTILNFKINFGSKFTS